MAASSWRRNLTALVTCGILYIGFVSAQEGPGDRKEPTPPPKPLVVPKVLLEHRPPKSIEELRDIEKHVAQVVQRVMPAVVGVRVGPGQGSGVLVKEGFILTAGHVSGDPKKGAKFGAQIVLPTGKTHKAKILGQFKSIDSGMLKLEDQGDYPALEMGKSSELKKGQWVIAIGHPGGIRPNRTPVVRVGRILYVDANVIRTDCTLVGGDSGGPLFDMQGRVIGIHSRIGGLEISQNMHVPVDTYRKTWDKLAAGESWGAGLGQPTVVRPAGGKLVFEKKDALDNKDPLDKVQVECHAKVYTFRMSAGHTYTIDLVSADKSGKQLDTFLRLEDPNGKEVAQDDDGGGFPNSRILYKPLRDGDYRIIATSFEPKQTGKYTLKVFDADYVDALVAGKADVFRAIKLPLPAVGKLLEEADKAKMALHINAVVIDAKGNPVPNKDIVFLWDQGKETLKTNAEGVVRWPLNLAKSKKLNLETPKDFRAMIALTDPDGVSLPIKDQSKETVKTAGGAIVKTIDGKLAKSDPFDLERAKCVRHHHEFKMEAGKTYTLDLVSEEFDAYLRIETDEKGKLAEDDDGGGFLNSRIVFSPQATGTFRIVVTTCDPGQFGTYRLTIRESAAKPAEPKKTDK